MDFIKDTDQFLSHLELGKKSAYSKTYNPELLQSIPRDINRTRLNLSGSLPFSGFDIWTFYELSFLNPQGLPVACVGEVSIPCTSVNLIESKSFKLYMNSFNFSSYSSLSELKLIIENDVAKALGVSSLKLNFKLFDLSEADTLPERYFPANLFIGRTVTPNSFINIDKELASSIKISKYDYDPDLLKTEQSDAIVQEDLFSNLLKSNCLVTGQPDWGSIYIRYKGPKISHESLLKYIVSFRNHNEFHEMCVERIFCDIKRTCKPELLTVFARYTRRGGIDINPFRSNFEAEIPVTRTIRQ